MHPVADSSWLGFEYSDEDSRLLGRILAHAIGFKRLG